MRPMAPHVPHEGRVLPKVNPDLVSKEDHTATVTSEAKEIDPSRVARRDELASTETERPFRGRPGRVPLRACSHGEATEEVEETILHGRVTVRANGWRTRIRLQSVT